MLTRSKSKGTNIGSSAADVASPNQPSSVPERLSSVLGTGTVNSQVDSVHSPRVSESEPSSVTRQQKSSSAPNSYHSPRVSETELSGKNQQQQSSFAPIAHRPRSTSSSASNHTIKRMAAEARHAKAMLKILEAEKAAHNSILSAELAAIESCKSSRKSSCTNSVSSWVRSLPDNLDIPGPTLTINKSIIPEAVGPSVAIKPEQDVADFGLKDMKNLPIRSAYKDMMVLYASTVLTVCHVNKRYSMCRLRSVANIKIRFTLLKMLGLLSSLICVDKV
ncbi:hypothetical protein ACJJTC_001538 [Scirpophaga incertulas]